MHNTREQDFNLLQELAGSHLVSGFNQYSSKRTTLNFTCNKCGKPFITTHFLYEQSERYRVCNDCCAGTQSATFINKFKHVHGDYYQYDDLPLDFCDASAMIDIICPKHGKMTVQAGQHALGKGCSICDVAKTYSSEETARDKFVRLANAKYNFKYRYENIECVDDDVTVTCPKHGDFTIHPEAHINGKGCPVCTRSLQIINEITSELAKHGVMYTTEKTFPSCVSEKGRALHFDIFVPAKQLCIEYDGIHHVMPTKYCETVSDQLADEYFQIQRTNDEIKNQFCKNNGIELIRIPYTEFHPEKVALSFIKKMPDVRHMYTWQDFEYDISALINFIKTFNYEKFAIYGISRGGLPFAVPVSNHFSDNSEFGIIKFQKYDGSDKQAQLTVTHKTEELPIFIIDDLTSSGETMEKVVQLLQATFPAAEVHPIVIFGNSHNEITYIRKHPGKWIVFPFEL